MVDVAEALKRVRDHRENAPPLPKLDDVVIAYVEQVVELCGGNLAAAARALGISRSTVRSTLDRGAARR